MPGRAVLLAVLGICLATSFVSAAAQATPGSIERVSWLMGCWELRAGTRVTTEMWMPPAGGMMIGGSRTVVAGATREFEHLRVTARGDTLIYTALPSGQSETHFRSTTVSETEVAFENRAHDFPQVIRYRRVANDSLVARIEGPGPDDSTRGSDFPMRRVSCTSVPSPSRVSGARAAPSDDPAVARVPNASRR